MKYFYVIVSCVFAFSHHSIGQNQLIDSLKTVVDTMPTSKEKVERLITISVQLYSGEGAAKYGWKAISEAQKLRDELLIADTWNNLASHYNVKSDIDSFELMATKAEYYYQKLKDGWGLASINRMRGHILGTFGQQKEANESFEKAMQYGKQAKHDRIQVDILNDWAIILRKAKKYALSIAKLQEALKIYHDKNQKDLSALSRLEFNLGRTYQENRQFEAALTHQKKAFELRKDINIAGGIAESQIQLLRMKLDLQEANQDTTNFQKVLIELGYADSSVLLDSLADLAEEVDHSGVWEMFYKISYRYHKETGDYKNALRYYVEGDQLEDSLILSTKNITALADLNLKYNNEVLQNEVLRAQISETNSTNQRNILILVAGAIILLSLLGILFFQQRLQARNIALQLEAQKVEDLKKQQQLIAMNAMLEGQDKERARIAKDLHDGLGNMLTTVKYQIAGLSLDLGNQFSGIQNKTEAMIDEACSEVRKIAHNMMPMALKQLGLDKALEDLCQKQEANHAYEVTFQQFGRSARLSSNAETMLYRIAQEIFNNINKHAAAKEIMVQLTYSEEWLNLTFEDDGKGFEVEKVMEKGGLGLHSIQSRVAYLLGECLVDSRLNEGTSISLNIPIKS